MREKFLLVLFILASIFSFGQKEKLVSNYDHILHNVVKMVEVLHYNQASFNDEFSLKLYDAVFEDLDADKMIFLSEDKIALKQFSLQLDDELRGTQPAFFREMAKLYSQRISQTEHIVNQLLSAPLDLFRKDSFIAVRSFASYPSSTAEKSELWKKYLTFQVLSNYVDPADSLPNFNQVDTAREARSRTLVRNIQKRNFDRMRQLTDETEYFGRYINTMIHLLDPHSNYFLPVDRRAFEEDMSGIYYGIGVLLQDRGGLTTVGELMIGGPAWRSEEVEKGDIIVGVRQESGPRQSVEGMAMAEIIKLTRGKKDTKVYISFRNAAGKVKEVAMKREALQLEDTFAKSALVGDSSKIGYIYLPKFYTSFDETNGRSSAQDLATEVNKLKTAGIKGLVVDLRDNGGGSLEEVIKMVGLFVGEGPVVQVKSRDQAPTIARADGVGKIYDGPLLVLVNERSASASEIFAAAIQDYQRGVILGSRSTFGKGTVQRGFRVPGKNFKLVDDLGSLHLTWQKYYRINGGATQLRGIEPDIVLPGIYENMKIQEKNFPYALPWDAIEPANFEFQSDAAFLPFVQTQSEKRRRRSATFDILIRNLSHLEEAENFHPLNLEDFARQRKAIRNTYDSIRLSNSAGAELAIHNTPVDSATMASREEFRKQSNNAWLNRLRRDLYLEEAYAVMHDLIGEDAVARKPD